MHHLSYLFPLILFTLKACTEEKAQQQTPAADLPSYSHAAIVESCAGSTTPGKEKVE